MALARSDGVVRSPLYDAFHAPRYECQALIRQYQDAHQCRLVIVSDILIPDSVALLEETLHNADPPDMERAKHG